MKIQDIITIIHKYDDVKYVADLMDNYDDLTDEMKKSLQEVEYNKNYYKTMKKLNEREEQDEEEKDKLLSLLKECDCYECVSELIINDCLYQERSFDEVIKLIKALKKYKYDYYAFMVAESSDVICKRNIDEQISLMSNVYYSSDSRSFCKSAAEKIAISKNVLEYRNCEQQLEFIGIINTFDYDVSEIRTIMTSEDVLKNRTYKEQLDLISYKKNNVLLDYTLITDANILKYRNNKEHIRLLDLSLKGRSAETDKLIRNEDVLKNRDCDEQIELINILTDSRHNSGVYRFASSKLVLKLRTIDEQIKLMNAVRGLEDSDLAASFGSTRLVLENRTVDEQIKLMKLYDKYNYDPNILMILEDSAVLENRTYYEQEKLLELYTEHECNPLLLNVLLDSDINEYRTFEEQKKLMDVYIQNDYNNSLLDILLKPECLRELSMEEHLVFIEESIKNGFDDETPKKEIVSAEEVGVPFGEICRHLSSTKLLALAQGLLENNETELTKDTKVKAKRIRSNNGGN